MAAYTNLGHQTIYSLWSSDYTLQGPPRTAVAASLLRLRPFKV